jgi:rare lipoprotein A (peptidoglycan hydrolase)
MSPRLLRATLFGAALLAAPPVLAEDSPTPGIEPQVQQAAPQPAQTTAQQTEKATRSAKKPVAAKAPTAKAKAKAVVREAKRASKANGDHAQVGVASWYGKQFARQKTANGEKFSPNMPTAAHRTLPLGTHVKVTNLATGQSTTVRVNDRGPYEGGRVIDLSQSAAKDIGMKHDGVAPVKIEVVGHDTSESSAANNAQVKQEAAAPKTDTPTQTASAASAPSAPPTTEAGPPPQPGPAAPAAQPKPVADDSSKPWQRLNRR